MSSIVQVAFVAAGLRGAQLRALVPEAGAATHSSVTHTHGVSAIAWGEVRVGVDVEIVRTRARLDRLAARTMTTSEHATWRAAPDRQRAFAQHWTRVEAYLKATGVGVRGGYLTRPPSGWSMIDLDLGHLGVSHVGALAADAARAAVSVRWVRAPGTSG